MELQYVPIIHKFHWSLRPNCHASLATNPSPARRLQCRSLRFQAFQTARHAIVGSFNGMTWTDGKRALGLYLFDCETKFAWHLHMGVPSNVPKSNDTNYTLIMFHQVIAFWESNAMFCLNFIDPRPFCRFPKC